MTVLLVILLIGLVVAVANLALSLINLGRFAPPPTHAAGDLSSLPTLAVCIPARNEEENIEAVIRSLQESDYPADRLHFLVYDDQSTDLTPRILEKLSAADARIVRVPTHSLPVGWNGKQHACHRMAAHAIAQLNAQWLLFTDADVRFEPTCLSRMVHAAITMTPRSGKPIGLLSTFPREITATLGELLLIPNIFFILLSYLPMGRMRATLDPAASAACGQFLLVSQPAYVASGGHERFRDSMHDGIKLPREVRKAGFATDLVDGTSLLSCRMYRGFRQSWRGFAKNAYEGLGSLGLLVFLSVCTVTAHVLPWGVLALGATETIKFSNDWLLVVAGFSVLIGASQRAILAQRFGHPVSLALLHPIASAMMMGVQWHSFYLHLTGQRAWKGRTGAHENVAG
ncbi:MAG: glycosyltransferase [Planctomycetes bacterium]|nr:glycosyltransferase [Planctomycetota bacterium]